MLSASTAIYFSMNKDITEALSGKHNITKQKRLIPTQPDKQGTPRKNKRGGRIDKYLSLLKRIASVLFTLRQPEFHE